ncbi:hypothetical protein [Sphingomonas oryzagri]
MTTIDWGSVADWVSGLGSMGAVIVALAIAIGDRRGRELEKIENAKLEAKIENEMLVEALFLYKRIKDAIHQLQQASVSGKDYSRDKEDWLREMIGIKETAIRLQQLPKVTVKNYKEFEGLIQLTRLPSIRAGFHIDEARKDFPILTAAWKHSSQRIIATANPLAPLNWES